MTVTCVPATQLVEWSANNKNKIKSISRRPLYVKHIGYFDCHRNVSTNRVKDSIPKYEKKLNRKPVLPLSNEWILFIRMKERGVFINTLRRHSQAEGKSAPTLPPPPDKTDAFIKSPHTTLLYFITLICLGNTQRSKSPLRFFFFFSFFFSSFRQSAPRSRSAEKTSTLFLPSVFNHGLRALMDVWAASQLAAAHIRVQMVRTARTARRYTWDVLFTRLRPLKSKGFSTRCPH